MAISIKGSSDVVLVAVPPLQESHDHHVSRQGWIMRWDNPDHVVIQHTKARRPRMHLVGVQAKSVSRYQKAHSWLSWKRSLIMFTDAWTGTMWHKSGFYEPPVALQGRYRGGFPTANDGQQLSWVLQYRKGLRGSF